MKFRKGGVVALVLLAGSMTFASSPAIADEGSSDSDTVVVNGREYGPEDGVTVTTESFEIEPGTGDTVGVVFNSDSQPGEITPYATWGASYATSTEYAYLFYRGAAKAAANVYSGKRIIQVCIQYTRNGVGVADRRCSSATSNGSSWTAGPETLSYATDTVDPNAPHTIFNIQTTRINPQIT